MARRQRGDQHEFDGLIQRVQANPHLARELEALAGLIASVEASRAPERPPGAPSEPGESLLNEDGKTPERDEEEA